MYLDFQSSFLIPPLHNNQFFHFKMGHLYRCSFTLAVWLVFILHENRAVGANVALPGEIDRKNHQYEYIGRYSDGIPRGRRGYSQNDYYVSVNPTTWSNAQQDCSTVFSGQNGGLVSIDQVNKRNWLSVMLERLGSGQQYWTGGQYSSQGWYWSSTGQAVPDFVLDSLGHQQGGPQDRIVMRHNNRFSSDFAIRNEGQPQRYICEVNRF